MAVETLFKRADTEVDKMELLNVIKEGPWSILVRFAEQQRCAGSFSGKTAAFLLDYIQMSSRSAAYLMLKTDGPFAAKKLDDAAVLAILDIIDIKTHEAEKFAIDLLINPRSDTVWKLAAGRLYDYAEEPKPDKFLHHAALARFVPLPQERRVSPSFPLKRARRLKKNRQPENRALWIGLILFRMAIASGELPAAFKSMSMRSETTIISKGIFFTPEMCCASLPQPGVKNLNFGFFQPLTLAQG